MTPREVGEVFGYLTAQVIERYRYLLKTAPPDAIEQAHEEAFARLSPEQRRTVLEQLSSDAPEYEQVAGTSKADDPRSLAKMATRAEMRRPGTLERTFGGLGGGGGMGVGSLLAGSFMSSIAGTVIGSMVAQQFFATDEYQQPSLAEGGNDQGRHDASAAEDPGQDASAEAEMSGDAGDDFGGGDFDV
ncbi:MAG: hypothetical protein LC791_12990 [Acidobacteria bacterium]|nr:hypothetical protein [Acidobacteriota bacterium]